MSGTNDEETPNEGTQLLPPAETTTDETNVDTDDHSEYIAQQVNKPFMLVFFRIQSTVCVVSFLLVSLAQALPAPHRPEFMNILVQFYILVSSIVGILVELELSQWFLNECMPILKYWFVRGLFYIYVGLFSLQESMSYTSTQAPTKDSAPHEQPHENMFMHVLGKTLSSIMLKLGAGGLFLTGALYLIFGALFLQGLKKRSEETYQLRLQESMTAED